MAQKGRLTEDQLVEKSIYEIGGKLAKSLEPGLEIVKQYAIEFGKMNAQYKDVSSINGFVKIKQREGEIVEQVNVAKKLQGQIELNLIKTIERKKLATEGTNKALIRERTEVNRLNKLEREAAVLKSKTSSAMDKAIVTRRKLIRTIQDLQAKQALGNKLSDKEQKELRQSTKEFLKYDKAIGIAKKSTNQFQENVGNYPRLMGGAITAFKSFIPLIGAGFGLREAWNFTKESIELERDARGVEFAFQRIEERTNSARTAFVEIKKATRGLLSNVDIKKAIVEFDNFNLETDQLATVLEFVAVRATQTGKSFEYLRDSAIEAISKESVRRADNLGLSQKELNDKIKEGTSFLDAFAEIAKREIGEAGSVLDEAANAQQKFNAALEDFRINLVKNSSIFGKYYNDTLNFLTLAIQQIDKLNTSNEDLLKQVEVDSKTEKLKALRTEFELIKKEAERQGKEATFLDFLEFDLKKREQELSSINKEVKELNSSRIRLLEIEKILYDDLNEPRKNFERVNREQLKTEKEKLETKIKQLSFSEKEQSVLKGQISAYRELIDLETNPGENKNNTIRKTVQYYRELIDEIKKEAEEKSETNKQWRDYQKRIEAAREELDKILKMAEMESVLDLEFSIKPVGANGQLFDTGKYLQENAKIVDATVSGNEIMAESTKSTFEQQLDQVRSFTNSATELLATIFDNQIMKYDEQIYQLERRYALEYDLAEGNARQQRIIRLKEEKAIKEVEEKRAKELRKQAIVNKAAAISNIAIDTAQAYTKTLGQTGIFGIPLAKLMLALGAIQAATVAAQPIPAYAEGTDDHKGGFALVGEERPEVIIEPGKDPYIIKKPTVLNLPKHTEVVPSLDEYQKLFAGSQMASLEMNARKANTYRESQDILNKHLSDELIKELRELKAINKAKKTSFNHKTDVHIDLGHLKFREDNISWS